MATRTDSKCGLCRPLFKAKATPGLYANLPYSARHSHFSPVLRENKCNFVAVDLNPDLTFSIFFTGLRNRNSETGASPSPANEGTSPAPRRSLRGADEAESSKALASALGLKRVDDPEDDEEEVESQGESAGNTPTKSRGGLELNRRGIPARKRKKNSLIYGTDDLVSIPVR